MNTFGRVILAFVVVVVGAIGFFLRGEFKDGKRRYREATEEPLVDVAYGVSSILENYLSLQPEASMDSIVPQVHLLFEGLQSKRISAEVWDFQKERIDLGLLLLARDGKLLFDSRGEVEPGTDMSLWNDVYRAKEGKYGSRTTDNDAVACSTMYLSVPVYHENRVEGIVTVAKPTCAGNLFLHSAKQRSQVLALSIGVSSLLAAMLSVFLITRPISQLTLYVNELRDGKRLSLPSLPKGEVRTLGTAIEEMRDALDDSKRLERYTKSISHELKSPLTSIASAVEIIQNTEDPEVRSRFLSNIEREGLRLRALIERLVTLQSLQALQREESAHADLQSCLSEVVSTLTGFAESKEVTLKISSDNDEIERFVQGNSFWISEVIQNVLQNALEFSPPGKSIAISLKEDLEAGQVILTVADEGPGFPEWAKEKLFDQFFSLPRPDSKRRSSGLGLAIVKEIMEQINGRVVVANRDSGGVSVLLTFSKGRSIVASR